MVFGSTVLSVVIGLFAVYFIFSTACSQVNELVAARFEWRADSLKKWLHKALDPHGHGDPQPSAITTEAFVGSSLIRSITAADAKKGLPSYIAPRTFSLTILDLLAPGDEQVATMGEVMAALDDLPAKHPAKAPLTRLAIEAGEDLGKFRAGVEAWFNDSMARISGWYKRRVQRWMFAYAIAITLVLNVDTFTIARTLWTQDAVRDAVVSQVQGDPGRLDDAFSNIARKLDLPLGWAPEKLDNRTNPDPRRWPGRHAGPLLAKLAGLAITAGALALGAPFWFDLLGRFARLRIAGERPDPSQTPTPTPIPATVVINPAPATPIEATPPGS